MILIISVDRDFATNDVIDWLAYYDVPFQRLNTNRFLKKNPFVSIKIQASKKQNIVLKGHSNSFNSNDITGLLIRRFPSRIVDYPELSETKPEIFNKVRYHLNDELERWFHFLLSSLNIHQSDFNIKRYLVNKLNALIIADSVNLKIPKTIVTTSKEELRIFLKSVSSAICKPLSDGQTLNFDKGQFDQYVLELKEEELNFLEESFFPLFIQEQVIKKYELRVFYYHGEICTLVYFSQSDEEAKVDYRIKMNDGIRNVPYSIPSHLEQRIHKFMKAMNLEEGSLDIIRTLSGEYVFLEVNPIGFYGDVSTYGNYYIDSIISKHLKLKHESRQTKNI